MSRTAVVTRADASVRTPVRNPVFDPHRCKQCGLCGYVCPTGILEVPPHSAPVLASPEDCSGCRACELICPDFAVTMEVSSPSPERPQPEAVEPRHGDNESSGDEGTGA